MVADAQPVRPPRRVQMSRQHPWRADNPDAVIVARPSKWGNPFRVARTSWTMRSGRLVDETWIVLDENGVDYPVFGSTRRAATERAVGLFAWALDFDLMPLRRADVDSLAGRDLACWCPLDQLCHADVLLEIANGGGA